MTKLRRKCIRIHRMLDKLEPLTANYRARLADCEAAIQILAPELDLLSRHRTHQPNLYFASGELSRIALAMLREEGAPLPIRVIAARVLARKGCPTPDRRVFRMTWVRLQQLFGRLEAKGVTVSVGKGMNTRRALAAP